MPVIVIRGTVFSMGRDTQKLLRCITYRNTLLVNLIGHGDGGGSGGTGGGYLCKWR